MKKKKEKKNDWISCILVGILAVVFIYSLLNVRTDDLVTINDDIGKLRTEIDEIQEILSGEYWQCVGQDFIAHQYFIVKLKEGYEKVCTGYSLKTVQCYNNEDMVTIESNPNVWDSSNFTLTHKGVEYDCTPECLGYEYMKKESD